MAGLNLFTNNAATTLASSINNSVTSLSVAAGTGTLFPTLTGSEYFFCTLANTAGTVEIVKVTARSTDTFTIVRGQDGTAAVSWSSGDKVELRLTRIDLLNFPQLDSTNTFATTQTFSGTVIAPTINAGAATSLVLQSANTTAITIDTSQRAAFVAGTAALPAITTTGDTNTGIWFPAADTIAFTEGGTESMRISSTGGLSVGTTADAGAGGIFATANITSYYSSDSRLKENIKDIPNALDKVNYIGGKLFDWTDDYIKSHGGEDGYFVNKSDFGVIAQDVKEVFSIAVRERQDKTLAVDYEKLCALAFAAIKELTEKVNKLEAK
jgi:hypothetical protein